MDEKTLDDIIDAEVKFILAARNYMECRHVRGPGRYEKVSNALDALDGAYLNLLQKETKHAR